MVSVWVRALDWAVPVGRLGFELRLSIYSDLLAALSRVAKNEIFSCLVKKPNNTKKAEDLKLQ